MAKVKPKSLNSAEDKPVVQTPEPTAPRTQKKDKESDAVRQFLVGCAPFEAETIRILIACGEAYSSIESLSDTDEFTLNCYLNYGYTKSVDTCTDALIVHRQKRVVPIAQLALPYVEKEQILPGVSVLLELASDEKRTAAFLKRTKGTPLAALTDAQKEKAKPTKGEKTSESDHKADSVKADTPYSPSLFEDGSVTTPEQP